MANIKVKDLADTSSITTNNQIMVLTNDANNVVQNITVSDLLTNVISSNNNNVLAKGTDNKLFVNNPQDLTGNLSNLTTTDKTNLVSAINELDSDIGSINNNTIGDLSNLDTIDKSSIVNSINEVFNLNTPALTTINNSKGMLTGDINTNTTILADVTSYAHSTFDLSKFTVTGSPVITNDGIASGFSNSNYLNCGSFGTTPQTSWSRSVRFKTPDSFNSLNIIDGVGDGTYNTAAYIEITNSGELRTEFHKSSLNTYPNAGVVPVSTWYDAEYGQYIENGSVVSYMKYKKDSDTDYTTKTSTVVTSLIPTSTSTVTIGLYGSSSNVYMNGDVDLKQFSITVDGIPVFSGNKTGIDTIKPDDYTPLPTNNPVAVPPNDIVTFGNNQYLSTECEIDGTKDWEIHFDYVLTSSPTSTVFDCVLGDNYLQIGAGYNNGVILLVGNSTHTAWALTSGWQPNKLQSGLNKLIFGYKASTQYYYILANGNEVYHVTNSATVPTGFKLRIGNNSGGTSPAKNLDLDSIKVYQEGDLVYQPCLKIPYTQSKTGSKVVDSTYRNRVTDMYAQYGKAPYYTLSDTDFTLPMGELYGLMSTVIETYKNGASWYRVYADGWCEQGGYIATDTNAVKSYTVNFLKEFVDTNYSFNRSPYWAVDTTAQVDSIYDNGYRTKNASSITFFMHESSLQNGTEWSACGYIN